jgi:hypothetical protein
MGEHTTITLAKALHEIPGVPQDMIRRVIDGHYHDFLSPLDFPEIQLVADLRALARHPATPRDSRPLIRQVAQRVIDGDFDASPEESAAWAASPEGRETFRQFADDVVFGGIVKEMRAGAPVRRPASRRLLSEPGRVKPGYPPRVSAAQSCP